MTNEVKVGVERWGEPPPGHRWNVLILGCGDEEATDFMNGDQYRHISMQFMDLAIEDDPTQSQTAWVDAVESFYELRDKGGILGGMNVRMFFYVDKLKSSIVVLGACKRQDDGPTPIGVKKRMARRLRKYLSGDFGGP
jgi:hypothetical protein